MAAVKLRKLSGKTFQSTETLAYLDPRSQLAERWEDCLHLQPETLCSTLNNVALFAR